MITAKEFPNKTFSTQEELFKELKDNKQSLISLKKAENKCADTYSFVEIFTEDKESVNKAELSSSEPDSNLLVKVVINTTNLMDSHGDVHINGIWKKTLSDNKNFLHLQEHEREFDKVITDTAKASVKSMTWKSLGHDVEGKTEALIFESEIEKKRNPFMYEQYRNGWVKNHSVGMRYVNIKLAINSDAEWDKEEKEVWDQYYDVIANKDLADAKGYFWAVTEAKIIEGSAVVMGSNPITPTQLVEQKEEPSQDTPHIDEPTEVTQSETRKRSII